MYIDSTDNSGMVMVSILSAVTLAVVLVGVGYVVWAAARHRRPGNEKPHPAGGTQIRSVDTTSDTGTGCAGPQKSWTAISASPIRRRDGRPCQCLWVVATYE